MTEFADPLCNDAQMRWDDLRYLLSLRAHHSLSAAAKALGVNHTTVARRVAALEEELGARLFDKTPAGFVPTRAGEDVLQVADRVQEELLTLDREVLGRDARLSGSLRVTTLDIVVLEHAEIFSGFCRRYPEITIETVVSNTPQSLTKREADVAIRVTNQPPQYLVGKRLGRLEFAPYVAAFLLESRRDPEDLESYPWMSWDERLNARLTEEWLRKNVPRAHLSVRLDSSVTLMSFLDGGLGAAFAPCLWADGRENLRRLADPEPGFGMDLWLLTHPDLRHTARVRAFIDHFGEAMAPLAERMSGAS